jgi:phosphoribosylformylglycinamidine synthase
MKAAVIVFPGSNREGDVVKALAQAGANVEKVWHTETALPAGTDLAVLPGGFSYGDYLRCGAIAGRAVVMDAVRAHAARGGLVLGICNGFQILCESGLLPGILMRNANLKFICHRQTLKVERTDTAFTRRYRPGQVIDVCVAHGEGNYTADEETLRRPRRRRPRGLPLQRRRGPRHRGRQPQRLHERHRGHLLEGLNVLGMMPHPENLIEDLVGGTDGRGLFESLVSGFPKAA